MARQVRGFFDGRRLSGWWVLEPEDCERVFAFDSAESLNAYFTFLYRDHQNREGVVQIGRPGDDRIYETSDATYCVPMGGGNFQTETDVHQTCPSHYAPPDFQTVTFPLFFRAGALDDSEGANNQTLRVAPDLNRPSDGLLLRWGATADSSSASVKPPAAPSASASASAPADSAATPGVFTALLEEARRRRAASPWNALPGTWKGVVMLEGNQVTVTLDLKMASGGLTAFFSASNGLSGDAKVRVVKGTDEIVSTTATQIVVDGRLSDDGRTIEGELGVWFWPVKRMPIVLTKQ
jgi:hypothetical protein